VGRRELIESYFEACNAGDPEALRACFTDDVAHYFTRLAPARGADALADHLAATQRRLDARWTVEHAIEQGSEACIEWSMTWTDPRSGERRLDRGTEWYVFVGERISEIRAYHHSDPRNRSGDLLGFDHAGRGHSMLD
jgi:ketosteroid isomerase-like protein